MTPVLMYAVLTALVLLLGGMRYLVLVLSNHYSNYYLFLAGTPNFQVLREEVMIAKKKASHLRQ